MRRFIEVIQDVTSEKAWKAQGSIRGHSWRDLLAIVLSIGVLVLLGLAGVMKLLDLPAFEASLNTWKLIPGVLRTPLAIGLPIAEFVPLALWLGAGRRRWGVTVAAVV